MNFIIEKVSVNGGRIGALNVAAHNGTHLLKTPLLLLGTKAGSVPYLSRDVLQLLPSSSPAPLLVSISNTINHHNALQRYGKGIAHFAGLKEHPVFCVVQDPCVETPSGFNGSLGISVWPKDGRVFVTPEKYISVLESLRPSLFVSLSDGDCTAESSQKRLFKSSSLTAQYLDKCTRLRGQSQLLKDVPLFAAIGAGLKGDKLSEVCSREDVAGFAVEGLHTNGESVVDGCTWNKHGRRCTNVFASLPASKPRLLSGAFSPVELLSLVKAGADIFESSLPQLAVERGCALVFPTSCDVTTASSRDAHGVTHDNTTTQDNNSDRSKVTASSPRDGDSSDASHVLTHAPTHQRSSRDDATLGSCTGDSLTNARSLHTDASVVVVNGHRQQQQDSGDNHAGEKPLQEVEKSFEVEEERSPKESSGGESPTSLRRKRSQIRVDGEDKRKKKPRLDETPYVVKHYEIRLTDKIFADDHRPLVSSCSCHTCEKFTRAYINHLLNTKELLGKILLTIHNLHHYQSFFDGIRRSIADDNIEQLQQTIRDFCFQ